MNLISENVINKTHIKYYDGIDIEKIKKHPSDGSQGMLVFFIENWEKELLKYNRCKKIESLLNNDRISEYDISNINNSHIIIYQAEEIGILKLYKVIKNKIERDVELNNWIPISSIDKGGIRINNKYYNFNI